MVAPRLRVPLAVVDGLTAEQALEQAQRSAHAPFDLATGPLVRAVVWRVAPREHLLLLVAHHIIADGWSLQVLLEELAAGPLAAELPAAGPGLEPADLALRAPTDPGAGLEFWTGLVAGATPAALPDRSVLESDAPPATPRCGHCRVALDESAEVAALARGLGATAYAVQLAALAVALHAFTRDSVIVGVPFAGRDDPRTHRTVGMLVNTMPVRVDVRPAQTPEELVTRVAALLREAMRHRDVPFAAVAGAAGARSAGQLPYLDVVLGTEPELPRSTGSAPPRGAGAGAGDQPEVPADRDRRPGRGARRVRPAPVRRPVRRLGRAHGGRRSARVRAHAPHAGRPAGARGPARSRATRHHGGLAARVGRPRCHGRRARRRDAVPRRRHRG